MRDHASFAAVWFATSCAHAKFASGSPAQARDDDEGSPVVAGSVAGVVGLSAVLGASAIYGFVRTGRCPGARPAAPRAAAR